MAEQLIADNDVFREAVAEIDAVFVPLHGWSLGELLARRAPDGVSLERAAVAHPAIFAVQVGLARCLQARGLQPAAVIGHSAGEVAAAFCAGVLDLADAVQVLAAQSALIEAVTPGAMLHVPLDAATLAARIAAFDAPLELAAINADQACVVAGSAAAVAGFDAHLKADQVETRQLSIRIPFHTSAVEPHLDAFRARLAGIRPQASALACYSSWRGAAAAPGDFDAAYWARHIRDTVQFPAAARAMFEAGIDHCIEVSPHPALLQHLAAIAGPGGAHVAFDATLQRGLAEPCWPAPGAPGAAATVQEAAPAVHAALAALGAPPFDPARMLHASWTELGFTSLQLTRMMADLAARLGRPLSVTLPYRHPTPGALIEALGAPAAAPDAAPAPAAAGAAVAIVGMACRLPGGANSPDALWQLLVDGTDPVSEIPAERWPAHQFYDADRNASGRSVTRWGSFIRGQDLRDFDARHFRMSPREASALDPQQRLLLEVTWEALENAGYRVPELKGRQVGVYVGISTDDYKNASLYRDLDALDPYAGAGAMSCTASGRLSYFFGWEGPNLAVDTACSGSLVALHLACQALRAGECEIAVVAGVNALLTPHLFVYFSKAGIMSPSGRCHVFDDGADGYVRAEGCGVLVLQRASDAEREARQVRARVLGSAVNQDGASTGFSAPNGAAQQKVLRQAWRQAGVSAADIGYLEAHGTGTPIGDPIELEAMAAAIGTARTPHDPVPVGSLKSNLGHLEAAAGVGAVIKTVLALEHGELAANLHFHSPNAHLDWARLPLRVVDRHQPFPERQGRRIAGVSSFGFSGTNAHVVLEQAAAAAPAPARAVQVLALGAPDQDSLRVLAGQYARRIARLDAQDVAGLAAATHLARPVFPARVALAAPAADLSALLQRWADAPQDNEQVFGGAGEAGPLAFVFTGQGCQYPGMARDLYHAEPAFRAVLDRCEAALLRLRGSGMLALLLEPDCDAAALDATELAQPAIFAVQCGLVALLASWGIHPQRVLGHSVGEFAAGVAAGALALEDALALVAQRASLMAAVPAGGAMAAVQVDAEQARAAIAGWPGQLAVAAINGKRSVVLSGAADALAAALERLGAPGGRAKYLAVSHAYHSPLMAPAAQAFGALPPPPSMPARLPWISSVDGRDLAQDPPAMDYWAGQILAPVCFDAALERLEADGCRTFLEIGPAASLCIQGRARATDACAWIASQQRQRDGNASLAAALAALAARGVAVDWAAYDAPAGRRRLDLPPYPFQRRRHWREPMPRATGPDPAGAPYPWLNHYALARLADVLHGAGLSDSGAMAPAWRRHGASCLALLQGAAHRGIAAPATLAAERARFLAAHPSLAGCLALLDDCLARYPEILGGRLDPLGVLFPGGSLERVAAVYANNEVQDLFNRHVGERVARLCAARLAQAPGQPVRVIEIGAGTGSTTAAILAALPPDMPVDYLFTDLSPAFLGQARQRFPRVRVARLDIERDPCAQGLGAGQADLIVANNVLHATADIPVTLANVRALAAPGAALVLNEQTELQAFIHLIFGLTDGWWRFADAARQAGQSPLLDADQWRAALAAAGFAVQPDPFHTDAGQTVFVATTEKKETEMAHDAPPAAALDTLRAMVAELTGMTASEIDAQAALIDLGLDSLMLVQLRTLLSSKLGVEVDMADFYGELDTLARLATVVPAPAAAAAPPAAAATPAAVPAVPFAAPAPLTAAVAAGAQPDLARLMEQQIAAMSRLISEQNALLGAAGAPAAAVAAPVTAATAPAAPVARPAGRAATPNFRSLKRDGDALTPAQQAFVDDLARRYAARTPGSKALAERSRHTLADWKNTLSFRYALKEMMYPIVAARSHGARFTDLDGNDFLDLTMGCGIALLGHAPQCVTEAVHAQVDASFAIGPQTPLAAEVAERFARLTGMDRVTFCNTGAEAVMMAVRMARAVTGRRKLVIFNGAYHGTWDGVLGVEHEGQVHPVCAGIPQGMVDDLLILNYGTDEALAVLREQCADVAAVLVEPVQSRRPGFHPAAFLRELRAITEQAGSALIFDEMITGFRIHPGGAQAHYGIRADLATYGKIVGGGLPLSVVAGSARFMDAVDGGPWRYGDDSLPQHDVIYFGGTYVKHPLALAAARAALDHIEAIGEAGYAQLNQRSARLADTLNAWFQQEAVPLALTHFGSLLRIDGSGRYSSIMQPIELDLFFLLLNLRGIYVWERRICFLSLAHTDADVDQVIAAVQDAVRELRAAGFALRTPGPGGGGGGVPAAPSVGPAASAQRRMFALAAIDGPGVVYNVPLAIRLRGPLDAGRLEQSLARLVARHPALRTRFAIQDDELVQQVQASVPFALETIDGDPARATACLNAFVRPFDLHSAPLLRAGLMKVDVDEHLLVIDAHHIVVDGLSLNILAQELMACYGGAELAPAGAGMIEAALAEAGYLASDACRRDAGYWRDQFRDVPPPLRLPLDHARPLRRRQRGADLLCKLDSLATARLKAAARSHKMPVFPLLLALYATLLHRVTSQPDLVIGLPVGGRSDPRFRQTVGMLAATLPLRMVDQPQATLAERVRACHGAFLAALAHQAYPLEALIAELDLPRDTSRNPLFDTMFIYEDGNDRVYRMAGLECEPAEVSRQAAMFDLALEVVEAEGELTLRCEYDVDLFEPGTAQAMLDAYVRLLQLAPDMLDRPVGELELADGATRRTVLAWGDGGAPAPHASVLQAFDARCAATPEAAAVIADGAAISWRELDQRANRLAHALLADGALAPDTPVALVARRDPGLLAGMLAILRAGAAYVPVDPDLPPARVRQMLEAAGCRHILASAALAPEVPLAAGARLLELESAGAALPASAPACAITPHQLAYVMFTSGSTGTPKAVAVSHANAASLFAALPQAFGFAPGQRMLALTTIGFDIAGLELLGALCCGMTVVLASDAQARAPEAQLALIANEGVEVLQMTPTRLKLLLDALPDGAALPGVRTLLVGGEALPPDLAARLLAWPDTRVFNVYGPTETTIWSASWPLAAGPVSLGRALPGERLLVLSAQQRLQPPGAVGEIAIAGCGVARGYLNDPERSAARFVSLPGIDGPVYLTGDLGRWRSDGSLEYLGRADDQVKLRGMRIDIGDVEHHLRQLPGVSAAAAAVRGGALGEPELVAYLVGPAAPDAPAWRSALAALLPAPMVPARFVLLPALPQTANGKTDRRALPAPELAAPAPRRAPSSALERSVCDAFADVLGRAIGPDDDFFLAGGESIRALRLGSRLRAAGLAFELRDLFRWPTPAALAANLEPLAPAAPAAASGQGAPGALSGLGDDELADLLG